MSSLYSHFNDVELTVGGALEKSINGSIAGPTFLCIWMHQFKNTRTGDRFWYETANSVTRFSPTQLESIRTVTFARILCNNGNKLAEIAENPFLLRYEMILRFFKFLTKFNFQITVAKLRLVKTFQV